jgi:hypothetical protein
MGMCGQRHAPAALYPREKSDILCTGGWVSSKASLDRCGKFRLHRDSIPGPYIPYQVAVPPALPGQLSLSVLRKKVLFSDNAQCLDARHSCGHNWSLGYPPLSPDVHCQEYVVQTAEVPAIINITKNQDREYNVERSCNDCCSEDAL